MINDKRIPDINGLYVRGGFLLNGSISEFINSVKPDLIWAIYNNASIKFENAPSIKKKFSNEVSIAKVLQADIARFPYKSYNDIRKLSIADLDLMCQHISTPWTWFTPAEAAALRRLHWSSSPIYRKYTQNEVTSLWEYNDCIQKWLVDNFNAAFKRLRYSWPFGNAVKSPHIMRVGIVARYPKNTKNSEILQSYVSADDVNKIVLVMQSSITEEHLAYEYFVFEDSRPQVAADANVFQFEHETIHPEDEMYDLYLMSKMDCFIQGSNGFAILGALLAAPGKQIITSQPHNPKYHYRYSNAAEVLHFRSSSGFLQTSQL